MNTFTFKTVIKHNKLFIFQFSEHNKYDNVQGPNLNTEKSVPQHKEGLPKKKGDDGQKKQTVTSAQVHFIYSIVAITSFFSNDNKANTTPANC